MKKQLLSLLLICSTFSSQAAIIYFGEDLNPNVSTANSDSARANFMSALTGAGTEDFESLVGNVADFGTAGTATITGSGGVSSGGGAGRFATSGSSYWETSSSFSIEFSNAVSAFGFYGTDIGDFGGQITVELQSGVTTNLMVQNTVNAPDGSLLFWGIVDTVNPFTKITFGNTNSNDVFGFDDMTVANASQVNSIPEPSTLAIFALGALGLASRRKKV